MSFDSGRNSKNTKSNNKSSSSLSYGLKGTGSTMPAAGTSTENPVLIGTKSGVSDELLDTIQEDSEQKLRAEATTSDASPERVAEDVIKKINKGETSYNFIPSSFEVFLLQNSKNKVLFNFTRPVFSYNLNIVSPVEQSNIPKRVGDTGTASPVDLEENITPAIPKQIDISNFSILFYKTKNKPASLEEIKVETNLYKTLIPAKKELSVIDFLDVNVDYYFYASPEQGLVDKIKDLIVTEFDLSINDFKITSTEEKGILTDYIYRVKIIKDGELYFLEKEVFDPNKKEDKKKTKNFFGTILAEPKYEFVDTTINNFSKTNSNLPFVPGDAVFDSGENYPYIKLRFKSKKSNRKFDVNLRYTVANTPPIELSENNIGQEKSTKYTKLKEFIPLVPTMFIGDIKYSNFLSSKDSKLSGIQFTSELKKIVESALTNPTILADLNKVEDFIIQSITQKELDIIKNNINKNSSIYKLFNKGILNQTPKRLVLTAEGYINYEEARKTAITEISYDNKKSFAKISFFGKNEIDLFIQSYQNYYNQNLSIENDTSFKSMNDYKPIIFYNVSLKDFLDALNFTFLNEVYYKYSDGTIESAKNNALLLINNLTEEKQTSDYLLSKASFTNFLSSLDSIEQNLLEKFIEELNVYYSSDNSKSIINVYNNKNDELYKFIGYTKQDLDKFINDYPNENYLKGIYTNLVKNIEVGKDIAGDSILQL